MRLAVNGVNSQLRAMRVALLPDDGVRAYAPTLLTAIYFRLAIEMYGGRSRMELCKHCHEPFTPIKKYQDYCGQSCRQKHHYYVHKKEQPHDDPPT